MFVSVQITKSSRIEKQSYQIDSQNALKMFSTIFGSIDNKTRHNNDKMRLKWYCYRNCIIANGIYKAADMWSLCQGPISWPYNQFVITAGFHDGTHQNQTSKLYLMCRREHFDAPVKKNTAWNMAPCVENERNGKTYYNWMQCKWFTSIFKLNKIIHVNQLLLLFSQLHPFQFVSKFGLLSSDWANDWIQCHTKMHGCDAVVNFE